MTKRGRRNPLNEVVIVLNDLQTTKTQLAESLAERLRERRIPCSVLSTTTDLARTIEVRQPVVLVLDYLLGETMTALDLIEQCTANNTLQHTDIVLWTDEPSIRVAVDAIRAGARDFIEMNDGRHLARIVATIERLRAPHLLPKFTPKSELPRHQKLAPISLELRRSYDYAESLAAAGHPILLLLGERGSGRSTLARHLHGLRRGAGVFHEIELDLWPHDPSRLVGTLGQIEQPHLLSHGATVMLDRAEFDSGAVINEVSRHATTLFDCEHPPLLIVGTACAETARSWSTLTHAAIIELPPLSSRRDDVQALVAELVPNAASSLLSQIMKEQWPGSFRQLTVALQDLAYAGSESAQWEALLAAKCRWERFSLSSPELPPLDQVRRALAKTDGDVRLAAAQLGVGVAQIRAAIQLPLTERTRNG